MSDAKTSLTPSEMCPETPDEHHLSLERDRQIFHLKTLYEASSELATATTLEDIFKRFLPIAMGPLGLTFGFAVILRAEALHISSLGLDTTTREHYERTGKDLVEMFFPDKERAIPTSQPTVLVGPHLAHDPNLPAGTHAVLAMAIDESSYSVIGFGPKISEEAYGEDEKDLLRGLAGNLSTALKKACADTLVHELNADLKEKNIRTEQALAQMEQAQEELNNRAFQLQTLYETTFELSALNDPQGILNAFLLTLMGTFSYSTGWIALYGPGNTKCNIIYRGPEPDGNAILASDNSRRKVLTQFVMLKDRMPHNNQSCMIEEVEAVTSLPMQNKTAILFSLNHEWRGAIGLGAPLTEKHLSDEMKRLITSLTGTFIVTLGNAKHIELIQDLNTDLENRNMELQATLDALTSAKHEINILIEAKDRIISLVHGEIARVWRASWLDASLIILAGIVLGALFNLSSPNGIELIPQSLLEPAPSMVDIHEAKGAAQNDNAIIIDARPAEFYKQGHIANAVNLPKNLFNFIYSMKLANLDPATPLLVYGRTISRHYDADVARELTNLGHENVLVIDGGFSDWEEAGYEVIQ